MICDYAMDDIDTLEREGLKPTPRDIVRLNALGCVATAAAKRNATTSLDCLPRAAAIPLKGASKSPSFPIRAVGGEDVVVFRQPTVGHELWMDEAERHFAKDLHTIVAIRAYALTRGCDALPCADDVKAVADAVRSFCEDVAPLTFDQIVAALDCAVNGASHVHGEFPAGRANDTLDENDDAPDGAEYEDWEMCVAASCLHDAQAVLVGASVAELKRMTRRQLNELKMNALYVHGLAANKEAENAAKEYDITLDEIRERLRKEKREAEEREAEERSAAELTRSPIEGEGGENG